MTPTQLGKQGNIKQLGGDFIFGPGTLYEDSRTLGLLVMIGNTCSFAHRMQHTEDRGCHHLSWLI